MEFMPTLTLWTSAGILTVAQKPTKAFTIPAAEGLSVPCASVNPARVQLFLRLLLELGRPLVEFCKPYDARSVRIVHSLNNFSSFLNFAAEWRLGKLYVLSFVIDARLPNDRDSLKRQSCHFELTDEEVPQLVFYLQTDSLSDAKWSPVLKEPADADVWKILGMALEDLGSRNQQLTVCMTMAKTRFIAKGHLIFGLDVEAFKEVD
jgi:hypothetical protein